MVAAQSCLLEYVTPRNWLPILAFLSIAITTSAQTDLTTSGFWTTASNWSPADVPNTITEDASLNSGKDVTLESPNSLTVGNVTATNNNTIIVNSGATLTLGASGTPKSLTYSNSGTLTVSGTLEIWGDLVVNNSLTLNVTGTLIIHGNVTMNNGGDLVISGSGTITVGGSVNGGNNTTITTSGGGSMTIGGDLNLGGGSSSIGGVDNSITVGGSCSCAGCSGSVCPANILPIIVAYFNAVVVEEGVLLNWATESEEDFDHFEVLRAGKALDFQSIVSVPGAGYNTYVMNKYSWIDKDPLVGDNYYWLKSVDIDGSTELFTIKHVTVSGKKSVRVFPNPVNGNSIHFTTNFEPTGNDWAIIYDRLGNELFSFRVTGTENDFTFDKSIEPGVYLLKYATNNYETTTRFVVTQ